MAGKKAHPKRQNTRRAILMSLLFLFPITLNFFSPYLFLQGAAEGILSGSTLLFGLLFLSSLFLGRSYCAWICPGAGVGDLTMTINDKKVNGKKLDWIKWIIWAIWMGFFIFLLVRAGRVTLDALYMTESGISVDAPLKYITYYGVLTLIFLPALFGGRRVFCHGFCWMSPFMIIGRKIANLLRIPSLRLAIEEPACIDCGRCDRDCPMSLPVNAMVRAIQMENTECILCGSCIDACPKDVIRYHFAGR